MSETYRAVVLPAFNAELVLEERAVPTELMGPDAQWLKVVAAGVCHSDLHVVEGRWPALPTPLVMGHEITVETPAGLAVVYPPWGCGACRYCDATEEQLCDHVKEAGLVHDGGYAEYVQVPHPKYLFPIGDLDPAFAATFGCSSLTPYRATRKALDWMPAGAKVVLIGAGGLGQFGIQYLRAMTDAHLIVADTSEAKRARALELGAHEVCDADELEGPIDVVYDYVGADATLAVANRIIRRGGLVVNVGAYGGSVPFGFSLIPHETWWTQSMWGSRDDLADVIKIAQRGDLQYSVERLPLEAAAEAHRRIRTGDVDGRLVLIP
jgi:propanol-preferring alcohol dehydrogenase